MAKYLPLAAANEFITYAGDDGVTHMKLQKLVFMALGSWLARHDESFLAENPQVWPYGPVFESLYHELKAFKSTPITEPQTLFDDPVRIDSEEVRECLRAVWRKFRNASAARLSEITHLPGSPWHQIASRHDFSVPMGTEIKPDLIRRYFRATPALAA